MSITSWLDFTFSEDDIGFLSINLGQMHVDTFKKIVQSFVIMCFLLIITTYFRLFGRRSKGSVNSTRLQ